MKKIQSLGDTAMRKNGNKLWSKLYIFSVEKYVALIGGGTLSGVKLDTMELITDTGERCLNHGLPSFLDGPRHKAEMYYYNGNLYLLGGKGSVQGTR